MSNQPEPSKQTMDELIQRNVETIRRIEQAAIDRRSRSDAVADAIAKFCGHPAFFYLHSLWFGSWLVWNGTSVSPANLRFDPPPFGVLTVVVSLEAIFLSTFILMSQNRQQEILDQRNHLDLQINMLAEQESSQILTMLNRLLEHFETSQKPAEAEPLSERTDLERIAEHLENAGATEEEDNTQS